jgi:hypothetical protein
LGGGGFVFGWRVGGGGNVRVGREVGVGEGMLGIFILNFVTFATFRQK